MRRALLFPFLALAVAATSASATSYARATVKLEGRAIVGERGPFLALGATYMQALRDVKFNPERFRTELEILGSNTFDYVRVLSMVDWPLQEIAPVAYRNRDDQNILAWEDYGAQFTTMLDKFSSGGIRVQLTLFADAQRIMPNSAARRAHVDRILKLIEGREANIILIEVANEAWQNGFPGPEGVQELRALANHIRRSTRCLTAITAPSDLADRSECLEALYNGTLADIATVHFSRDLRAWPPGWQPVIDGWDLAATSQIPISNNEPIGPGASVASETDPTKLLAAAALTWVAGMPMYVFHSEAGVHARESFATYKYLPAFRRLKATLPPDLPNWSRNDGLDPTAPFDTFLDDESNQYRSEAKPGHAGLYRNYGARKGNRFVCLPIGVGESGARLRARSACNVTIYALPEVDVIHPRSETLAPGDILTLPADHSAYLILGEQK